MTNHAISIAFQTDKPISAYGPLAATAEGYGFDGVTVYNDLLFQPAWLPIMEITRHTRRARREAALNLSIIAELDHTLGLGPELLDRIKAATAVYDFEQVASYISDDLLRRLVFAGPPDEVTGQAAALFEVGAQRVEFGTPHGLSKEGGPRLLGEQVLPALRGRYVTLSR